MSATRGKASRDALFHFFFSFFYIPIFFLILFLFLKRRSPSLLSFENSIFFLVARKAVRWRHTFHG